MTDRLRYRYGYTFLYPPALKRALEHSLKTDEVFKGSVTRLEKD